METFSALLALCAGNSPVTGHRWIPLTKASDAELLCFLWSAPWINGWVNNRKSDDLRRRRAHYDVIVISFKNMRLNMSGKCRPFCLGLNVLNKQRVLMHRHQGLNVPRFVSHLHEIFIYIYIYELFIAFVCFVEYIIGITWYCGALCGKWQARESTGMFGNLMAIY